MTLTEFETPVLVQQRNALPSELIKKCPFCKSRNTALTLFEQAKCAYVTCYECDAEGPVKDTGMDAIGAWNEAKR